jgi:alkanesulfonate monooxygenase SsuD/methylene tetrahydromethanopterin reductase-like flavin-dependent oxidoreductase (luciferase family)
MYCGLDLANQGAGSDPRWIVELAQAAEQAGWDGLFMWDHWSFAWGMPSGDPWVILAAVAQATTKLRLGTAITPLSRRRPHVVANTLATLDHLSNGRMVFGAGLGGVLEELSAFGEVTDAKTRATMLDEGLEVVARLLAGERVNHHGRFYTIDDVQLLPYSLQQPRMPIWIGAASGNALRRAALWEGWVIYTVDTKGTLVHTAADITRSLAKIRQYRRDAGKEFEPYDIVVMGVSRPGEGVDEYAAIGATWWLETIHGMRVGKDEIMDRVQAGPPR